MAGKIHKNKNRKITAEKAYDILLDTVINYDWHKKITLYIPKIKSLFPKTPAKMQDIIQGAIEMILLIMTWKNVD